MGGALARSGEEIRSALVRFAAKWGGYGGSEKAEAQTFLNELFDCYGSNRQTSGALFEDFKSSAGFMDLHWPGILIVEMKRPGVKAETAREQIQRYWLESSDDKADIPAARYVIICNFHEFEIWEPGRFPTQPRLKVALADLPDKYDALLFLADTTLDPVFAEHHRAMTKDAARHIAALYLSLADRSAAPIDETQRFVLQSVWCLFAEDLGMLEGYPLQKIVKRLLASPEPKSAMEIGFLFRVLNQKGHQNRKGDLQGTRYVNGSLFLEPAEIDLTLDELRMLNRAAEFDWRQVDPTIFGSLLEGVLGEERRAELGAHYTHEADIMKIVTPTIIRPWRERIDAVTSVAGGVSLLDQLCSYKVLDPSCGCGNFLYVAYRELRGLEQELKEKIASTAAMTGTAMPSEPLPFYPLHNLHGIDIEGIAVLIARLTLWMGQRQMIDRFGPAENPLPLVDMSSIRRGDALANEWPEVDAIIGNPPFLGSQLMRGSLGDSYLKWLKKQFGVGIKDLCVYWFRKAQDHLQPGQRAGLVGTNSVSQNRARSASLEYIVGTGGVITDAVSTQRWPGQAKVHVSIVNWVKSPVDIPEFTLDGVPATAIDASLHDAAPGAWTPLALAANKSKCFQGPTPAGDGFIIDGQTALALLSAQGVDYRDVVRPYLVARDINDSLDQGPSRWAIDFGIRPLEKCLRYRLALDIVRRDVKPKREGNARKFYRDHWWLFAEPRRGMRTALEGLPRYIAIAITAKRLSLCWVDAWTLPSNLTNAVALSDDYSMGILLSSVHESWAWHQSSTLKGDLRYTSTSVFETFPWPSVENPAQRDAVAELSRSVIRLRQDLCKAENIGLTKLYNLMDEGAYEDLRKLHKQLDEAVVACYGWPKSLARNAPGVVEQLIQLNSDISEGVVEYVPFVARGEADDLAPAEQDL